MREESDKSGNEKIQIALMVFPSIPELDFYGRRLININIRYTTFLCPSQIRRSKPEITQTALLATKSAACL